MCVVGDRFALLRGPNSDQDLSPNGCAGADLQSGTSLRNAAVSAHESRISSPDCVRRVRVADELQPLTILMVSLTVSNLPFFSAAAMTSADNSAFAASRYGRPGLSSE